MSRRSELHKLVEKNPIVMTVGKKKVKVDNLRLCLPGITYFNSSGSYLMDLKTRNGNQPGGFPGGKIVEFYGPKSSGKSTAAALCVAAAQRRGGFGIWIGPEGITDEHLTMAGVNYTDEDLFTYYECETLEGLFNLCNMAVFGLYEESRKSGLPVIIVADSLSSLASYNNTMDVRQAGESKSAALEAKTCHQAFRDSTLARISGSGITMIFIRHQTESPRPYAGEKTTHGSSLDYHAWLRLRFKRTSMAEKQGIIPGYWLNCTCTKSKIGWDGWDHAIPWYRNSEPGVIDGGYSPGGEVFGHLLGNKVFKEVLNSSGNKTGRYTLDGNASRYPGEWADVFNAGGDEANQMWGLVLQTLGIPI